MATNQEFIDKLLQDAQNAYENSQSQDTYQGDLVAPLTDAQKEGMYELEQSSQLGQEQQALWQMGQNTIGGVGQSQQMAQGVYDTDVGAATQKLFDQYYNQDLLNQQVGSMKQDMYEDYYRGQTQSEWNDVGTGGSGSSRAGVAESVAYDEMNENMLAAQTNLQSNMYNNAMSTASQQQSNQMNAQLQASNQMLQAGQSGMAAYGQASNAAQQSMMNQMMSGSMGQQQQQQQMMSDYFMFQQEQQKPWDDLNQYANIVYGAPQDPVKQDSDNTGAWLGAAIGAAGMFFSDLALKENIVVQEIVNGVEWVSWTWNEKANEIGLFGESEGVIAQDVRDVVPDAVELQPNGYLAVNYDLVKAHMGEA